MSRTPDVVRAAGALTWRRRNGQLEVAVVHRPRYDDWSWPKGKLDPGEDFPEAAVREVWEETGYRIRLGIPLPSTEHVLASGQTKFVRYWAGHVIGGDGTLENEIDDVVWLTPQDAREKLTYPRDADPLDALVAADEKGELETWALVFVRHSHAVARSAYRGKKDWHRPISDRGKARSKALVPVLSAWLPDTVVSSSSTRCVQTVKPYIKETGATLRKTGAFSEESFEKDPRVTSKRLAKLLKATSERAQSAHELGEAPPSVGLCTHRPLIPYMVADLTKLAAKGSTARRTLGQIRGHGMDKGEVLVCQLITDADGPRVVSAERIRTPMVQR